MSNMLTSLTQNLSKSLGILADQQELIKTLKATAFKSDKVITDEQMGALLIVAQQYGLNPWTKEIYAYPDKSGIVPVVGVDGWSKIINNHAQLDGIEFNYSQETFQHKGKLAHEWIECVITRKDRNHKVVVREYFDEVCRNASFTTPWDTHPKRMHRHKALIQASRVAFGFSGIYDDDEADGFKEKVINPIPTVETQSLLDFEELLRQIPKMGMDELMAVKTEGYSDEQRALIKRARINRKKDIEDNVVATVLPLDQQLKNCMNESDLNAVYSSLTPEQQAEHADLYIKMQAELQDPM